MILDAGKAHGVKPGQAVIDQRGMIGRIFLAGNYTSWVILLTDLNSRIPVNIEPGNAQAIMAGDNSGAPLLDLLSQNVVLKPGAQVVSSGDGGLLPPGLAIGTVVGDSTRGYRVVLLADPSASDDVNIVDFKLKTEQPPATTANQLPATAAGLPPALPPQPAPVAAPLANATAPVVKPLPTAAPPLPPAKPPTAASEPSASDTGNE
jgi:rod shape-determining protein MreC